MASRKHPPVTFLNVNEAFRIGADPDLPYMNKTEAAAFRKGRKTGEITWFKAKPCPVCSQEMMNNKKACSKECWEKVTDGQADV